MIRRLTDPFPGVRFWGGFGSFAARGIVASSGGGATLPTSGMIGDFDLDVGVTTSAGDITEIADQSGAGNNVTGSGAATLVSADADFNGHDSADFGGSAALSSANFSTALSQPNTNLACLKMNSSGVRIFDSNAVGQFVYISSGSEFSMNAGAFLGGSVAFSTGDVVVLSVIFDGVSSKLRVWKDGGSVVELTGDPGSQDLLRFVLGGDGAFFDGKLARRIAYNRRLSASELADAEQVFADRYSVHHT